MPAQPHLSATNPALQGLTTAHGRETDVPVEAEQPRTNRVEPNASAPQLWVRRAMLLLLVVVGIYSVIFLYHAVLLAFATGELAYTESTWLLSAIRVRHGLTPYFDYSHAPYLPMVYPPLVPGLAGLLGSLLGVSDDGMIPLARLLTVGGTLAVAGAIVALCRRLGAGRLPAVMAGLLFFTPVQIFSLWATMSRGDLPAVALGLWAVAALMYGPKGVGVLLAGMLAGLAVTAKQTALAPALACGWWLLFPGRRGGIPLFIAGFGAAVALVFAPFGSEGMRMFLQGMADLSTQPWSDLPFFARLGEMVTLFGLLIPVAIVGLLRPATPRMERRFFLSYAVAAVPVLLVSSGKVGSTGIYNVELMAVIAVLAGLGMQWLSEVAGVERGTLPREVALGVLALVMAPLLVQTAHTLMIARNFLTPGVDDLSLKGIVAATGGPVFSENGYLVLNGADPPYILDPFFFSVMSSVGRWDPEPLRRMVAEKRFSALVLTHTVEAPLGYQGVTWLPQSVQQEMAKAYKFWAVNGRYYLYLPAP